MHFNNDMYNLVTTPMSSCHVLMSCLHVMSSCHVLMSCPHVMSSCNVFFRMLPRIDLIESAVKLEHTRDNMVENEA